MIIRKKVLKMSKDFTIDELLLAADILCSLLDEAHADNRRLRELIDELAAVLKNHDIPIPYHILWHNQMPTTSTILTT